MVVSWWEGVWYTSSTSGVWYVSVRVFDAISLGVDQPKRIASWV